MVVEPLLAVGVGLGEDGVGASWSAATSSDLNQAEPPGAPEAGLAAVPGFAAV